MGIERKCPRRWAEHIRDKYISIISIYGIISMHDYALISRGFTTGDINLLCEVTCDVCKQYN